MRRSNNGKVSPSLLRAAQVTLTGLYTYNKVFKQCPTEFAKCLTFFAKCRTKGCQCELSLIIIATFCTTSRVVLKQHVTNSISHGDNALPLLGILCTEQIHFTQVRGATNSPMMVIKFAYVGEFTVGVGELV